MNLDELKQQLRSGENLPPDGAVTVYRGRNHVYAVKLDNGIVVNVKAFHTPRGLNGFVYGWLRKSKARRSWENAARLAKLELGSPASFGYIEVFDRLHRLGRSYYLCFQMSKEFREVRHWEEWPETERDALLEALGKEIVRIMRKGVLFKDFSPGNILFKRKEDGSYIFCYVDLNRMRFGVWNRRKLMRMLRAVNIIPAETARLARATARAAGWDEKATEAEALRLLDGYFAHKRRLQWLKRLFKKK